MWVLILQSENTSVLDTGRGGLQVRAVYQMALVPGCRFHSKNTTAGDTLYEAEIGSLHLLSAAHSSDSTSTLGRSCQLLKKEGCTEENIRGTRKWQLKGTQEAKELSLVCSKPIHGMAWLWHSVFKRREN